LPDKIKQPNEEEIEIGNIKKKFEKDDQRY